MLLPKRVKYRKQQRGRMKGMATRGNKVAYGEYGHAALDRHDPLHQAWRTGVDKDIPRQAGNVKGTRYPYGIR